MSEKKGKGVKEKDDNSTAQCHAIKVYQKQHKQCCRIGTFSKYKIHTESS